MVASTDTDALRKAAIVLIALGPKTGGEILKRLPDSLVERLTAMTAQIKEVDPEERRRVFQELFEFRMKNAQFSRGGEDFAKEMLEQAVGQHRASKMFTSATGFGEDVNFEVLKRIDPLTVSNFLKSEQPQTIALVLAHLDPRTAAGILTHLPSAIQAEVTHKMATLDRANPEFVKEVESTLASHVKGEHDENSRIFGGTQHVAEIMAEMDQETWGEILDEMREIEEEIAIEVKNLMFVFEDIVTLDDRYVREFLKEVDSQELTMALKAASPEVKEKIFSNMSKRASAGILEDMEYMGPVKLSEVQEAQQRVVDVIRRLEEEGLVVIGGGSGGDMLV